MNATTTDQTVEYTCPQCFSYAEIYTEGYFQGIWECTNADCGASGLCEHPEVIQEVVEMDILGTQFDSITTTVSTCTDCKLRVEA